MSISFNKDQAYQTMVNKAHQQMCDAEKARSKKQQAVINDVIKQMRAYSITIKDLHAACKAQGIRLADDHLYRDPTTGKTWRGVGRRPNWIKSEIQNGVPIESFRL